MKCVSLAGSDVALLRDLGQIGVHQRAQPRRGPHRFFLADRPAHLVQSGLQQFFGIKRRLAGEQFVEQHAQRVDVAARVNVQPAHLRLFRTHVGRRADELFERGEQRLVGQPAARSPWRCRNQSPSAPARRRASVTRMFEGLMSRWMMPFWCACWMAWQTWMNRSSRSAV